MKLKAIYAVLISNFVMLESRPKVCQYNNSRKKFCDKYVKLFININRVLGYFFNVRKIEDIL